MTGVHFRGELQHVGDVSKQKIKCRPIRSREIGGVTLSDVLYAMKDYHNVCLKGGVLLLVCMSETFRKQSLHFFELDSAYYLSTYLSTYMGCNAKVYRC